MEVDVLLLCLLVFRCYLSIQRHQVTRQGECASSMYVCRNAIFSVYFIFSVLSSLLPSQSSSIFALYCLQLTPFILLIVCSITAIYSVERSSSVVECRTRNRESPGSNHLCYRFEVWAFFVHFTDAPVHSAV